MTHHNPQTAVRLTPEARLLVRELRSKLGLTATGVIEMAIRRLAEAERVKVERPPTL